jgi:hypothetical protein
MSYSPSRLTSLTGVNARGNKDRDLEQRLVEPCAGSIDVAVDREAGAMQFSSPLWVEANLLADLLRRDHADNPAKAARDIWILSAPFLRHSGMDGRADHPGERHPRRGGFR